MHELSVTQNIIGISCDEVKKHPGVKVLEIRIAVGELTGLIPQCIQYYFDIASRGTLVEGAKLKIRKIPLSIKCNECGKESIVKVGQFVCPNCGSDNFKLNTGKEFYIESLEVE